MATLTELTAISIKKSLLSLKEIAYQVIACGGGVKNSFLMSAIEKHTKLSVTSTSEYGFNPQAIRGYGVWMDGKTKSFNNPLIVKKNKGLLGTITKSR